MTDDLTDRLRNDVARFLRAGNHTNAIWVEQAADALEKVHRVLAEGVAGDGRPLDLDTYEERVVAALAYLRDGEIVRTPMASRATSSSQRQRYSFMPQTASLKRAPRWVSVEERLPPDGSVTRCCLVVYYNLAVEEHHKSTICFGEWDPWSQSWAWTSSTSGSLYEEDENYTVTHWLDGLEMPE